MIWKATYQSLMKSYLWGEGRSGSGGGWGDFHFLFYIFWHSFNFYDIALIYYLLSFFLAWFCVGNRMKDRDLKILLALTTS